MNNKLNVLFFLLICQS